MLFSSVVSAEDFNGKWQVCDVLNITGEVCDQWWLNATESYNFTAGSFVIFDITSVPSFEGFDISDGDVFIVDHADNLTIISASNLTIFTEGNFTLIADSNFTINHFLNGNGSSDFSSYINRSDFDSLLEDRLSIKKYALSNNVVDKEMIKDYFKKDAYGSEWDSKLKGSLVVNGSLWSAIDSQVPESENLDWVKVLVVINLIGLFVLSVGLGKVYLE